MWGIQQPEREETLKCTVSVSAGPMKAHGIRQESTYLYEKAQVVTGHVPKWAWTTRCFSILKLLWTVEISML